MDNPQVLLAQVVEWHARGQYEPIVTWLRLYLEPTFELTTTQHIKTSLYTYFGDSLSKLKHFRKALVAYKEALTSNDSRRASKRFRTSNSSLSIIIDENELKYRIFKCHMKLHEIDEAREILEKIPTAERSVEVLCSLADLYSLEKGVDKAKELYLEALRQDPLRIDCVTKLCKLSGCEAAVILDILPEDVKRNNSSYLSWIQAQCYLHSTNPKQAVRLFSSLAAKYKKRPIILASLAQAHYHEGDYDEAIKIFQSVQNIDPYTLDFIDSYAVCLSKNTTCSMTRRTLEELAISMSSRCGVEGEYFYEPWLVMAQHYATKDKKDPKALLFAQKAYKLNRMSIEALILLACLCLEKKEGSSKAISYILTAHNRAPYRFEVQRVLCDAFLAINRKGTALKYAQSAIESLGQNARSYYLKADITLKSLDQRRKSSAKNLLEKSLEFDKGYLPAVLCLSDLLIEDKKISEALSVLEHALPYHSMSADLHKYLYTCYKGIDDDEALYHHSRTTSLTSKQHETFEEFQEYKNTAAFQDDIAMVGLEADELVDHDEGETLANN